MAISKILYIGDCGAGYAGKHLKQALDYITVPEKTGGGRFVGSLNCQQEQVYEQMRQTKEQFGKERASQQMQKDDRGFMKVSGEPLPFH